MPINVLKNTFIGRKKELEKLNLLYAKSKLQPQLVIISGKIRSGKTQLIKEFLKAKPNIYYLASKGSNKDQLQTAVEIFTSEFEDTQIDQNSITNWKTFFEYLGDQLKSQKVPIIIVFDEFLNLIDSDEATGKFLLESWEYYIKNCKIMLILSGSSTPTGDDFISQIPKIASKKTDEISLDSFSFSEVRNLLDTAKFDDLLSIYAITGGVPAYLKEFNTANNLKHNIQHKILNRNSFLYIEPELLMRNQFNEPKNYITILKAIGIGNKKYSDISGRTSFANNKLSIYLKNLVDLKLIKRELPISIADPNKSKKGLYSVCDPFMRFYFSFILPNLSLVESEKFDILFEKHNNILKELIRITYKEISLNIINMAIKEKFLPEFETIGKWWSNDLRIDYIGRNSKSDKALFVDVKSSSKITTKEDYEILKQKSKLVKWANTEAQSYYCLISKTGFTSDLIYLSKTENLLLIHKDIILQ